MCFPAECWKPAEEPAEGPEEPHQQCQRARRRNHQESQKVGLASATLFFLSVCLEGSGCAIRGRPLQKIERDLKK